jgi:hypothetical protein
MEKIRIQDGKKSYPGSGINIPDPQHCVLYLCARVAVLWSPSAVAQPDELRQVGPNKKGEKFNQLK